MWHSPTFVALRDQLNDDDFRRLEVAISALGKVGVDTLKAAEQSRGSLKMAAVSVQWIAPNDWVFRTKLFYIRCSIKEGLIVLESFHLPPLEFRA